MLLLPPQQTAPLPRQFDCIDTPGSPAGSPAATCWPSLTSCCCWQAGEAAGCDAAPALTCTGILGPCTHGNNSGRPGSLAGLDLLPSGHALAITPSLLLECTLAAGTSCSTVPSTQRCPSSPPKASTARRAWRPQHSCSTSHPRQVSKQHRAESRAQAPPVLQLATSSHVA